jgi:hypothetical protein
VQPRPPRQGPGAELGGRRPQGVGGLLGVASLHPAPTARQRPTPTRKRVVRGRASGSSVWYWSAHRSCSTSPPQCGQRSGRGRVEGPVGVGRCHPVAVAAVGVALLASRLRRRVLRLALGERGRLALPRPAGLLQEPLQLNDAGVARCQRPRSAPPASTPARRSASPPPCCTVYSTARGQWWILTLRAPGPVDKYTRRGRPTTCLTRLLVHGHQRGGPPPQMQGPGV